MQFCQKKTKSKFNCSAISIFINVQVDIWSLGISLIEFAQMEPPFHEMSPMRVLLKIQKSDPPRLTHTNKWSRIFHDFLTKCLVKDPHSRCSADELLQHPFLGTVDRKPVLDLLAEFKVIIFLNLKGLFQTKIQFGEYN